MKYSRYLALYKHCGGWWQLLYFWAYKVLRVGRGVQQAGDGSLLSIIGRKCSARFRESAAFVFGQSAARDEEVHAKRLCSVGAELRRPCQPVF